MIRIALAVKIVCVKRFHLMCFRSLDGTGNFNWRMVFPFDYLPQERLLHVEKKEHLWSLDKTVTKFPPVLNIQVWDNDLFGPNEYISMQIKAVFSCFGSQF